MSEYQLDPTAMPHLAHVDALHLCLLAHRIKYAEVAFVYRALLHLDLDLDQAPPEPVRIHFLGRQKVIPLYSLNLKHVFLVLHPKCNICIRSVYFYI